MVRNLHVRVEVEPIEPVPHPLLAWAQELAAGLVREDGRARLSDELYPDVVGEILLARLERQDPVKQATAWLRAEHSWRHHLPRCSRSTEVDGMLTRLRLSGLRDSHGRLRLAHHERAAL